MKLICLSAYVNAETRSELEKLRAKMGLRSINQLLKEAIRRILEAEK